MRVKEASLARIRPGKLSSSGGEKETEFRVVGIYIQEFLGDNRIRIPVIPTRNQKAEIPVETVFSREIVGVHRGRRINLQNSGANFAVCLARSTVGSQLSIANKAFVGVVRRASNFIKMSDVVLSDHSSPPESNTV